MNFYTQLKKKKKGTFMLLVEKRRVEKYYLSQDLQGFNDRTSRIRLIDLDNNNISYIILEEIDGGNLFNLEESCFHFEEQSVVENINSMENYDRRLKLKPIAIIEV